MGIWKMNKTSTVIPVPLGAGGIQLDPRFSARGGSAFGGREGDGPMGFMGRNMKRALSIFLRLLPCPLR